MGFVVVKFKFFLSRDFCMLGAGAVLGMVSEHIVVPYGLVSTDAEMSS